MKKIISFILIATMCISLIGCAANGISGNSQAEIAEAIETLKAFIKNNSTEFAGANVYQVKEPFSDTSFMVVLQGDVLALNLSYTLGRVSSEKTKSQRMTILYLTGYQNQKEGYYYASQSNSAEAAGIKMAASGGYDLRPDHFSPSTALEIIDFKGSGNAEITDEFIFTFEDGLHTILEILNDILSKNNVGITLADLGFSDYQIDSSRKSDIKSGAWVKDESASAKVEAEVAPAPITVYIKKIDINSAGTPELYLQFENTGNSKIIALDFYVRCFDAYGDTVKGYGRYDVYQGTHQEGIAAGGKSAGDMYWGLFGFENTQSVEVAIMKYKVDGQPTVEIPAAQLVWVK